MNKAVIFNQLLSKISWVKEIIRNRDWNLKQDLIIENPANENEISEVEKELGVNIPDDYKDLFRFSKHVEFRYQFDEEMPEEFRSIFSGEIYWNLNRLKESFDYYKDWVEASLDPAYNDSEAIEITKKMWANKLPLMEVANGDLILVGNNPSEVIYFSHEGDKMHGKKLGNSLWEFLDFHSTIGFIGSENWQFEPFYDFKADKMDLEGRNVSNFIDWLEK